MQQSREDWYADKLNGLEAKPKSTEADVSGGLVRPVLEKVFGFRIDQIDEQPINQGPNQLRPDFICGQSGSVASVILEVKNLNVDLFKRTGGGVDYFPVRATVPLCA